MKHDFTIKILNWSRRIEIYDWLILNWGGKEAGNFNCRLSSFLAAKFNHQNDKWSYKLIEQRSCGANEEILVPH